MNHNGRGPWYWLTFLSPLLGFLGSRSAGDRAAADSEQALRDILPFWLIAGAVVVLILVVSFVLLV